ncbi:hypothetical protein HDK90DRAFT_512778 [Phyllosticta capitalensis]|uniref:Uncharacterized protein n=1 Tax=Phyllosticta capitalensis TaxID=121624 RepID=A0ABR1YJE3_9PEZI
MAVTRSKTRGKHPPPSDVSKPPDKTAARKTPAKPKAASRRRVAQEKKVDRLTALPLELFRMILEEFVADLAKEPYGWKQRKLHSLEMHQMINLRFVCKLFNVEIVNAIFATARPLKVTNSTFWDFLAKPFVVDRLLLAEVKARPNSTISLLALIHQVVDKLMQLQGVESETIRQEHLEATCQCVLKSSHPRTIVFNLRRRLEWTYDDAGNPYNVNMDDDVVKSCSVVACWMGNISLLEKIKPKPSASFLRSGPRFMGTPQWAAARNGQMKSIKYLQGMGISFKPEDLWADSKNPLLGALRGNHTQAFQAVLPAYDCFRTGGTGNYIYKWNDMCHQITTGTTEAIFRAFWTHKPTCPKKNLCEGLIDVCLDKRQIKTTLAQILIEMGAPINEYSNWRQRTPLEAAIEAGPPEFLELLLQSGGNVNAAVVERVLMPYNWHMRQKKQYRSDPILKALDLNKIEAMEVLLRYCKWETATKANVLLEAVNKDRLDMVKLLVSPVHFDPKDSRRAANMGRAAVRQARADLKTEILSVLIAHGCE